jgi:ubiquinone/menaquinone biosynthesis C-methylase UbiE
VTSEYIHGGTDSREIARLETQAAFVAPWSLVHFDAAKGMHILDLGTGIGAMAAELAKRYPGTQITGLDRSEAQLAVARARHPVATYVQGDATAMPFADGTFDRVHASWLLEHVPDPAAVVREVRRVLRRGGVAYFVEVDNATLRLEPPIAVVTEVMELLNAAQLAAGGDPFVGRKLGALFEKAGFLEVRARSLPLVGDQTDPLFYRAFAEEFAGIFESVDESLGPDARSRITAAASRLRAMPGHASGAIHYAPVIVRATS